MTDSRKIEDLHPALQRAANELIRRMKEKGYPVLITSTYRDNECQNNLYAQGRTKPGSIVTNAKGGQSIHNYRLAFDICKNVKGQEWSDNQFFAAAGAIGQAMGLEWGGSWTGFVDRPHFQFTNGLTLKQLQAGQTVHKDIRLPWEAQTAKGKDKIYMVEEKKIKIDQAIHFMHMINHEGYNYVKLQDLGKARIEVSYDTVAKLPILTLPKK